MWRRYVDRAKRHIYSYVLASVKDRSFAKDPRSIAYFIDSHTIRAAARDRATGKRVMKRSCIAVVE